MPRKKSKAVSEGNGSVPHHDEFGCSEPTMEDLYRMLKTNFDRMDRNFDRMPSYFDRQDEKLGELIEKIKQTNQRLAGLEPRLAAEANIEPDVKTRRRTEGASAAAKNGDSSPARVEDGPTCLTSFGMIDEPLLMAPEKCIGDALVDEGAEAPKPHLSPAEVHAIIRRPWHTIRQHSLYNNENHVFSAASFLDPRGQDQEWNQPNKLQPAYPSLLEEVLRNKIKVNFGV